jgi:hypothetical protein
MGSKTKKGTGAKARKNKQINLLELIPIRDSKWTHQENNKELIRLLRPRFKTPLGKRIGSRLNPKPTYNIHLDEFGTAVWKLCNGKLSVGEIGDIIKIQFGESVEPLYPRLAEFFRILELNKLIKFKPKTDHTKSGK